MIRDLGYVEPGTTLYLPFHTFDSNDPSASVTLTGLATTDIEIYKDGSTTQRASDSGYALLDTDGIDFDTITGIHGLSINLADNTTAGFYAAGSQYWVVISSVTVDAATVNFILCTFRIGYQAAILNTTIASLTNQTSFTLTNGPAEDDALNGSIVLIHDVASAVQKGYAVISDYTGSTKTVTLSAGTTFTAAAADNISVFPPVNATGIPAVVSSKLTQIYSDTTIIYSDTTLATSDVARCESKAVQIYSDTTIAVSKAVQIYSDTTIIYSDTTLISSDVARCESKAVQVYSDTTAVHSDTTAIHTQTTTIASDAARIESKAVQIYSDTTVIEAAGGSLTAAQDSKLTRVNSKATQIYSDTTIIYSDTTLVTSDAARIESKAVQIYSDSTAIHSDTTAIHLQTTTVASDLVIVASDLLQVYSDTTLIVTATNTGVAPGASGGLLISGSNSGTTTFGALTVTGATTHTGNVALAAGLTITQSTSNGHGVSITGNGTGEGVTITGGATGHGVFSSGGATSGAGLWLDGNGGQNALELSGAMSVDGGLAISANFSAGGNLLPWNSSWDAEVQSEANDALVANNLDKVYSDTTHIHSKAVQIYSDTAIASSKAVQIYSDTTIVASKAVQIYSDTTAIHGQTTTAASKVVQIYSDTTIVTADGPNTPTKGVEFANLMFMMVDATDLNTPETGVTITATISKDGGAFGACTNSAAEVSGGWYKITLTSTEMNADVIAVKFTGTGCAQRNMTFRTQPT